MNAAKTILEGLFGWKITEGNHGWIVRNDTKKAFGGGLTTSEVTDLCNRELSQTYGSVQKAAEEAANWWNNSEFSGNDSYEFEGGDWRCISGWTGDSYSVTALKVISKAVKAGWEG